MSSGLSRQQWQERDVPIGQTKEPSREACSHVLHLLVRAWLSLLE